MWHVSRVDRSDSDIFETLQHACTWNIVFIIAPDLFWDIFLKQHLNHQVLKLSLCHLKEKKGKKWGRQAKTHNQWVENVKHALDLLLLFRDMFNGHKTCLAATPYISSFVSQSPSHLQVFKCFSGLICLHPLFNFQVLDLRPAIHKSLSKPVYIGKCVMLLIRYSLGLTKYNLRALKTALKRLGFTRGRYLMVKCNMQFLANHP